jgi:pyruvate/2-oxoglutarate dehydrogenase complex dihydrolipoamide acyltransferase (E2) component
MAVALMGRSELNGIPLRDMLGKSCKVTIVHRETDDGQTFANIATYKALKKGTKVPAPQSELVFFSLDPADVPALADLKAAVEALPERERDRVQSSVTYKELLATLSNTVANKGKTTAEIIDDGFPSNLGL